MRNVNSRSMVRKKVKPGANLIRSVDKGEGNAASRLHNELENWLNCHGRDLIDEGGVLSYSSSEFTIRRSGKVE